MNLTPTKWLLTKNPFLLNQVITNIVRSTKDQFDWSLLSWFNSLFELVLLDKS